MGYWGRSGPLNISEEQIEAKAVEAGERLAEKMIALAVAERLTVRELLAEIGITEAKVPGLGEMFDLDAVMASPSPRAAAAKSLRDALIPDYYKR